MGSATKDIKLKDAKTIKTLERDADLADKMKKALIRTADGVQNVVNDEQVSPDEYTAEQLQSATENAISDVCCIVEDGGRIAYREMKLGIQNITKPDAERAGQKFKAERYEAARATARKKVNASQSNSKLSKSMSLQNIDASENRTTQAPQSTAHSDKAISMRVQQAFRLPESETRRQTIKSADRSIKNGQRAIKTAEESSKVAIKTAQESAKAAQRSAQAMAKAAQKAAQISKASAKAAAEAARKAAFVVAKIIKAIIAAIKGLVVAIAAGGWVSVIIIVVIMLVALVAGSSYGIFFSSEDTNSPMTMKSVVHELNMDYQSQIDRLRNTLEYDKVETTGARAVWPEVLSVYAVKLNTDPDEPQEVATVNEEKKAMLEDIFWEMNRIEHRLVTTQETVVEESADEEGNIIETPTIQNVTTLYITISHKSAEDMALGHGFNDEQKLMLKELLRDENLMLWASVLYGIHSSDDQIVAVAESQIGNVGGEPYWSWYGFTSRVEWCACFVSWCANECGYIDLGIVPKFAGCVWGALWFQDRGQWADGNATPVPGMIIFFDWDSPNGSAGPQDGVTDHVGIVEYVEDGYVHTIEGNSGDSCHRRSYRIGHYEIYGYGIPSL